MRPLVRGVRSIEIETADLDRAARFYADVWGLQEVEAGPRTRCFRGTGRYHHILALHQASGPPAVRRVVLDALDRSKVDRAYEIVAGKTDEVEPPHELSWPGGGYGMGFKDPEGRNFAVVCDVADHSGPCDPEPDRPHKVSHANLNSPAQVDAVTFLSEALQLQVIDETPVLTFLRCDSSDHHSLVVAKGRAPTLNHFAFEMPDLDSVMRGAGRMRDAGYPIEWGVGRHGCGNNVYAYFAGPDELPLEYTAEVQQVGDDYVPRGPDHWRFPPGRSDRWGVTDPQSPRLKRIQEMFGFAAEGFRLG